MSTFTLKCYLNKMFSLLQKKIPCDLLPNLTRRFLQYHLHPPPQTPYSAGEL